MILREIVETLALLTPWDIKDVQKVRIGRRGGDGGYVLLDMLRPSQKVYSFGIAHEVSFDLDMAERGLDCFMFDHTIEGLPRPHPRFHFHKLGIAGATEAEKSLLSLADHVAHLGHTDGDMILKMDVEGWEWPALAAAPTELLSRFEQISMEVHRLPQVVNPAFRRQAAEVLRKLNDTHTLFHVHANNHSPPVLVGGGLPVCPLLELSYVRSDLVERLPSRTLYPTELDAPNVGRAADTPLWFFPFTPVAATPEEVGGQLYAALARLEAQAEAVKARERRMAARAAAPMAPAAAG